MFIASIILASYTDSRSITMVYQYYTDWHYATDKSYWYFPIIGYANIIPIIIIYYSTYYHYGIIIYSLSTIPIHYWPIA